MVQFRKDISTLARQRDGPVNLWQEWSEMLLKTFIDKVGVVLLSVDSLWWGGRGCRVGFNWFWAQNTFGGRCRIQLMIPINKLAKVDWVKYWESSCFICAKKIIARSFRDLGRVTLLLTVFIFSGNDLFCQPCPLY